MHPFLLVICRYDDGTEYVEHMEMKDADLGTVIYDLMAGQWDRPVQVILVDIERGTCQDISGAVAMNIVYRVKWESYHLIDIAREFVERHGGQQLLNELPETSE